MEFDVSDREAQRLRENIAPRRTADIRVTEGREGRSSGAARRTRGTAPSMAEHLVPVTVPAARGRSRSREPAPQSAPAHYYETDGSMEEPDGEPGDSSDDDHQIDDDLQIDLTRWQNTLRNEGPREVQPSGSASSSRDNPQAGPGARNCFAKGDQRIISVQPSAAKSIGSGGNQIVIPNDPPTKMLQAQSKHRQPAPITRPKVHLLEGPQGQALTSPPLKASPPNMAPPPNPPPLGTLPLKAPPVFRLCDGPKAKGRPVIRLTPDNGPPSKKAMPVPKAGSPPGALPKSRLPENTVWDLYDPPQGFPYLGIEESEWPTLLESLHKRTPHAVGFKTKMPKPREFTDNRSRAAEGIEPKKAFYLRNEDPRTGSWPDESGLRRSTVRGTDSDQEAPLWTCLGSYRRCDPHRKRVRYA